MKPHFNAFIAPANLSFAARFRLLSLVLTAVLLTAINAPSAALAADPANGVIHGRVANAATGRQLEGAVVEIPALNRQALSDDTGAFTFADVPPGTHTIVVSYTGLDAARETIEVGRAQRVRRDFDLSSQVYRLGEYVVMGDREGNAVSITRQHNASNVVNVVSMDAYGNVADGNIGNFMKRLSGISTTEQNGDVIGIGIRGTPPAWNAVNIDGTRSSSAVTRLGAQGDRATVIDQVPSEFVKEVEVHKALTPDQAADSIGGSINLVTKSPLDFKESVFTYRAGFNFNTYRDGMGWNAFRPTGAFSYLTPLGRERKFGLALTASYSETHNPREVLRQERIFADGRNTSTRMQTVTNTRVRAGGSLKFNYRPNEATDILLTFSNSYYSGQQDWQEQQINPSGARRVADYSRVSRAQIEAGAIPRDSANQAAGVAPGFTDGFTELLHANAQTNFSYSTRYAHNNKVEAGVRRNFGADQSVYAKASYNPSDYRYTNRRFFLDKTGGFGWAIDSSRNRSRPAITQTYGPSFAAGADLSIFTARLTDLPDNVEEDINRAQIDYVKKFTGLAVPFEIKAGGDWRNQARDQDFKQPTWAYVGPDGVAGPNPATGINDDNLNRFRATVGRGPFNGFYPPFNRVSLAALDEALRSNPQWFRFSAPADTVQDIDEDVVSLYLLGRAKFQKLNITGGVRREETKLSATGRNSDPRNPGVQRVRREGSYVEYFPSVHFRYDQSRNLQMRLSYSTGMTRPLLAQLFPATTVSYNDLTGLGQVNQANTALKPQTAENYDASIECYLEPGGVISVGAFRKEIKDFIAADSRLIGSGSDNGFGGQYNGFTLISTRNFGAARIEGYEINYSQRLQMLPRPLNGLAVFANYTHLKTSGSYADGAEELEGFVPKILNGGIYYTWRKLELRAAYNYMGSYLGTYSSDPIQRLRLTPVETWDFNVQYKLSPRLTFFGDVLNASDRRASQYSAGDRSRIMNVEAYGKRLSVGISGRF